MKKTAIGISDFKEIIDNNYYFVDKSLLIHDVINSSKIILYPRPRRFGKTLNLSMLKYFYDIKENNSHLFKELMISKDQESMQKQGKHPVIFLSFKDIKSSTFEVANYGLKTVIANEYKNHAYLMDSDALLIDDKEYIKAIINTETDLKYYTNSLKNLTEYLFKHHKSAPIVLIDEYDMPIQASYMHNYYAELIEFIRNFLSGCLKDNIYLEKAVLTGILRVAKESIFSGLNNISVNSILCNESADKFGFTENEVVKTLADYNLSDKYNSVKEWYDGYNFGDNREIFNPWSILNFVNRKKLSPYWVNTSGNDLIKSLLKDSYTTVKTDLEKLINGEAITKKVNDNIVYNEVSLNQDALWNFLLMSGYLRFDNLRLERINEYADLSIPNLEVQYLFETEIISEWFSRNSQNYQMHEILHSLTDGDVGDFCNIFVAFCQNSFSYFDIEGTEPEKFYHAFVLGMIVSLRDRYNIKSNRESGFGRYDIMLIPTNSQDRGFVFEFKKVNKIQKESFKAAMKSAKKQIVDKNYAAELQELGIKEIINIAAVFDGKKVAMEFF